MTDLEFDVLDELYFVTDFDELSANSGIGDDQLRTALHTLYEKGWVKVLQTVDDEVPKEQLDLLVDFRQYSYLATKEGLLAHNHK